MAGFDRNEMAALARGGEPKNDNLAFWILVLLLPVVGLLGGYVLLSGKPAPSGPSLAVSAPVVQMAGLEDGLPGPSAPADSKAETEPEWSAVRELARYSTVQQAMSECAKPLGSAQFSKTMTQFRERNSPVQERLIAIKDAEWKAGRLDRRKAMEQANNEMMLKMMTGQAQMEALEMMTEFQKMEADAKLEKGRVYKRQIDPSVLALLGGQPDLATCSKLNIAVQARRHDLKTGPRD